MTPGRTCKVPSRICSSIFRRTVNWWQVRFGLTIKVRRLTSQFLRACYSRL